MNVENRTLFIADNLDIMRGFDSETIDLIYLDPPFNTKKNYKAPIGSPAEGASFKDIWTDDDIEEVIQMAKVELTEEEANEAYLEGYREGRGRDPDDLVNELVMEPAVDLAETIGRAIVHVVTFGFFDDVYEKEDRLKEIYDAGYEQGEKDKEEYDRD